MNHKQIHRTVFNAAVDQLVAKALEVSTPLQMADAMCETLRRMHDGHVYRAGA